MPELRLKCKDCGIEFPSGIVMDRKSFETCILQANFHTCPKGHTHQYNKKDYFYQIARRHRLGSSSSS